MDDEGRPPHLTVLRGGDSGNKASADTRPERKGGGPGGMPAAEVRAGMTQAARDRRDILALRAGGASIERIAEHLGKRPSTVGGTLKRIFEKWEEQSEQLANEAMHLELHRIDVALSAVWPKVVNTPRRQGEPAPYKWNEQREAIELMLKLQQRRAKYLGLDAPEKHEHSGVVHHEVVDPGALADAEAHAVESMPRPADITLEESDILELPMPGPGP
jgi:hypothetical protein